MGCLMCSPKQQDYPTSKNCQLEKQLLGGACENTRNLFPFYLHRSSSIYCTVARSVRKLVKFAAAAAVGAASEISVCLASFSN